jgi:hypothetical protein
MQLEFDRSSQKCLTGTSNAGALFAWLTLMPEDKPTPAKPPR